MGHPSYTTIRATPTLHFLHKQPNLCQFALDVKILLIRQLILAVLYHQYAVY